MRYAAVINGCSGDVESRAREMYTFAANSLPAFEDGLGILVYNDENRKEALLSTVPFAVVYTVRVRRYRTEVILDVLDGFAGELCADLYVFEGTDRGGELAARFASRRGGTALTGVNSLRIEPDGRWVCEKPVYSGYLRGELEITGSPACISPAKGSPAGGVFRRPPGQKVRDVTAPEPEEDFIESFTVIPEEGGGNELETAGFILAAGNGVTRREEIEEVREAARYMGAEFGASRPVAMNGWAPMNRQLGASGTIGRPEVCLALGVSGSAAFMTGIDKSGFIAAVNIDAKAPIMKQADAVVVEDYRPVLKELVRLFSAEKD